jgi:predicted restriction endonuclease
MKTKQEIEQLAEKNFPIEEYPTNEGFEHFAYKQGYTQCQENMVDEIIKLKEKLKLIEYIADEMTKDLIEQSEFFDGGFESVAKYYNYKQSLNKQD